MDQHGFGYMTVFRGANVCTGITNVISGVPPDVFPRCLRCRCRKCNTDVQAIFKFIRDDIDFWLRRHVALHGYLWRPSLSNMRALHVAVSRRVDVPRTEVATLCLHASRVQMRCIWHGKRVLEQWFRFVAWRRRAWIRVTFVHRVSFECLTIIGAMVFAPPRRLVFRR